MKQNLRASTLYPLGEPLSNPPQVVVQWPRGLSGPPGVYPLGNSDEESEVLRGLLENIFSNKGTSSAGSRG